MRSRYIESMVGQTGKIRISNSHKSISWKSKLHNDGSSFDGWFIAGMDLPTGTITYHLPIDQFWDKFDVAEIEKAPEWDGHTSDDVVKRLINWIGEQK